MAVEDREPAVRVTLTEVYRVLLDLRDTVKPLPDRIDKLEQKHHEDHEDHESRLRALERRIWSLPTLAGVLAAVSVALQVLRWLH